MHQYFPTSKAVKRHEEVVKFACGLLNNPALIEYVYNIWLETSLHYPLQNDGIQISLLESLYSESQVKIPDHHFHNKFVNYYDHEEYPTDTRAIYFPSKAYVFSKINHKLRLGQRKSHDMTEAMFFVIQMKNEQLTNTLSICCKISERQPAIFVFLMALSFPNSTEFCSLRLSSDIQSFIIVISFVPPVILSDLLDQLSQSTSLHTVYLYDTSLANSKALNLNNKVRSLSTFALVYVVMDKILCENLLRQTMFLNNLINLIIEHGINENMKMNDFVKSGLGEYCEIPPTLCPEFLRGVSNFNNLVLLHLSGNTLTGCLPNFITESQPELPTLEKLQLNDAGLNIDDLNHITNLIQDNKIPNIKEIEFDNNNFEGFEDTIEQLINAGIQYQTELKLSFRSTNLDKEFTEKLQKQCKGTNVDIKF